MEINQTEKEITELTEKLAPVTDRYRRMRIVVGSENSRRNSRRRPIQIQRRLRPTQRHRPLSVWSSNKARHRLSRTGNRQLNAAIHRIAMTQAHWHPAAKAMMDRRKAGGDSGLEALRILKRRLSDVVYAALRADLALASKPAAA